MSKSKSPNKKSSHCDFPRTISDAMVLTEDVLHLHLSAIRSAESADNDVYYEPLDTKNQEPSMYIQKYKSHIDNRRIIHYGFNERFLAQSELSENDKNEYEKTLWKHAITQLTVEDELAVMMDIICMRKSTAQDKPSTHSVILLKDPSNCNEIYILDPSKAMFSQHIAPLLDDQHQQKFHVISYPPFPHFAHTNAKRDCNDIGVKMIDSWMYYMQHSIEYNKHYTAQSIADCVMLETTNNLNLILLLLQQESSEVKDMLREHHGISIGRECPIQLLAITDDNPIITCRDKQCSDINKRFDILKVILEKIQEYCNNPQSTTYDIKTLCIQINESLGSKYDNSHDNHDENNQLNNASSTSESDSASLTDSIGYPSPMLIPNCVSSLPFGNSPFISTSTSMNSIEDRHETLIGEEIEEEALLLC